MAKNLVPVKAMVILIDPDVETINIMGVDNLGGLTNITHADGLDLSQSIFIYSPANLLRSLCT